MQTSGLVPNFSNGMRKTIVGVKPPLPAVTPKPAKAQMKTPKPSAKALPMLPPMRGGKKSR